MNSELLSNLESAIAENPEKLAIAQCGGDTLTFAEFAQTVESFAGRAVELGIRRGDYVSFEIRNAALNICMTLALYKIGAVSVTDVAVDELLAANIKLSAFISLTNIPHGQVKNYQFDRSWFALPRTPDLREHINGFASEEDIAFVFTSSGTSGKVKFLPLTVKKFDSRLSQYRELFENVCTTRMVTQSVRTCLAVELTMLTLSAGGTVVRPQGSMSNVLKFCRKNGVREISAAPSFIMNLVRAQNLEMVPLPEMETVFTAGSAVSNSLLDDAEKYLCTNIVIGYGATELGITAVATRRKLEGIAGACGFIGSWVKAETVDENGNSLLAGQIGKFRFRTNFNGCIAGYLSATPEQAEAFLDGWFYPGDLGYIRKDGLVVITGRLSNLINMGGRKISPEDVERMAEFHADVLQAAAVGISNSVGYQEICIAVAGNDTLDLEQLRQHMFIRLGSKSPIRLMKLADFPLNQGGKIDRSKLKIYFENQS